MLAATARFAGDLDLAEECVQDAYLAAIRTWRRDGIPPNPGGCLTTTARRRVIDSRRRERTLRSVANLTREDGEEFLRLAPQVPITTRVTTYPLERTQDALEDLRAGRVTGAAVVTP